MAGAEADEPLTLIDRTTSDLLAFAPIDHQTAALEGALRSNPAVLSILDRAPTLGLRSWYLGAGAVAQVVWNVLHGYDPAHGIKDYDLVYFDSDDLSTDGEQLVQDRVSEAFSDFDVHVDVKNQARVHLWYSARFGRHLAPYRSTEHAIATWPTTASSIAVRYDKSGFVVYVPFGMHDLFGLIIRPNKVLVSRSVYEAKAARWRTRWPGLRIVPW